MLVNTSLLVSSHHLTPPLYTPFTMAAPPCQDQLVSTPKPDITRAESSTSISSDHTHRNHNKEETSQHDLLAERSLQGSNLSALFNIVCVVAGTGTLGLPYSLAKGTITA